MGYYQKAIPTVLGAMKQAGFPVSGSKTDVNRALVRGGVFGKPATRLAAKYAVKGPFRYDPKRLKAQLNDVVSHNDTLMLISYTLPFHRSPESGINQWLLEVLPENRLLINSADAREKGIGQGDEVTVTSLAGKDGFKCRAQIMPGIRPGVVALARGFGYRDAGAVPQTVDGISRPPDTTRGAGVNPSVIEPIKGTVRVKIEKG